MKTIGIIGTRRRDSHKDFMKVFEAFKRIFENGDRIVSGGCLKGGDRFAEVIAKELGITIIIHFPNWSIGRGAGFIRNTYIAEDSDWLIACVADDRTGGTEDTIKKFQKKKLLKRRLILV